MEKGKNRAKFLWLPFFMIGSFICFMFLFKIINKPEEKIVNTAFSLEDKSANLKYNALVSSITDIGYSVNMIADEEIYSINGTIENENFLCDIYVSLDLIGNVVENTIKMKINDFSFEKIEEEHLIFSQTLNIYGIDILIDDFREMLENASKTNDNLHSIYESNNAMYEVYSENETIYITYTQKEP